MKTRDRRMHGSLACRRRRFYRRESGAAHLPSPSKQCYVQAVRRLYLAVINQALTDVLENEEEAEAAKQWLSSRDFDSFVEPLGCGPDVFRQQLTRTLSNTLAPETEPTVAFPVSIMPPESR